MLPDLGGCGEAQSGSVRIDRRLVSICIEYLLTSEWHSGLIIQR